MLLQPSSAPAFLTPNSFSRTFQSAGTTHTDATIVSSGANTNGIFIAGGSMTLTPMVAGPTEVRLANATVTIPPMKLGAGAALTMRASLTTSTPWGAGGGAGLLMLGANVLVDVYGAPLDTTQTLANCILYWSLAYRIL